MAPSWNHSSSIYCLKLELMGDIGLKVQLRQDMVG